MADSTQLVFEELPLVGCPVDLVLGGFSTGDIPDEGAVGPPKELVFSKAPLVGSPVNLVFGDDGGTVIAPDLVIGTVDGTLPPSALQGAVLAGAVTQVNVFGALPPVPLAGLLDVRYIANVAVAGALPEPALVAQLSAEYVTNTVRPTVCRANGAWQAAEHAETGAKHLAQSTLPLPAACAPRWQRGTATPVSRSPAFENAARYGVVASPRHQMGVSQGARAAALHADAQRGVRKMLRDAYQQAERAQSPLLTQRHQDGIREYTRATGSRWQTALGHPGARHRSPSRFAAQLVKGWAGDYGNAIRPPIGQYVPPPIVVVPDPCYLPDTYLMFDTPWAATPNLIFFCERHDVSPPQPGQTVVVLPQRVYIVLNNASLRRVDGNLALLTTGMSLSLDRDSWTWQFSASLPAQELAKLEPDSDGDPVEVELLINGTAYRAQVESISRERVFGQASIRIGGRGLGAVLDAPYAPVMSFTNTGDRTAQQIMADVLTVNGVSMGWGVTWGLADWLVPAGAFQHQGSYISALNAIAQAAGGYVQPHPSLPQLIIRPSYPSAPWKWATEVTPDFSLPAAVTTREGIEWVERARYNRVFVSGQGVGVLGQVTRAGTAGDSVAQMIVDPLITHATAARQRGTAVLSNTGRIANVSLRLPVLAETNIIVPGKFVDYIDGSTTRRGIVRSVQVDIGMPEIWQTIGVETHESV